MTQGMSRLAFTVGTPDLSRSHFQATEELERAAPGTSLRTGWLDRVLGASGSGTPPAQITLAAVDTMAALVKNDKAVFPDLTPTSVGVFS